MLLFSVYIRIIDLIKEGKRIRFSKYSETINNEYIGKIYQMSSWQFFNEFYYITYISVFAKINSHEYAGTFLRVPYNHLIKKLNICNIPLSESEEYDIWWIL